jgi:tetratricopeptide (TPR) repeat protein
MQRLLFSILLAASCQAEPILVLPFFNQSKSASVDWIGESIAETIRESLATHRLLVLEREDRLEAFRRLSLRSNAVLTKASIIKVGEMLDAGRVIYGQYEAADSAASSKSSLRITARILDLQHMRQGPEFTAAGALEDLALLETNVGWQLLKFLAPKTAPSEQELRQERPPVRVDAIENYVRGLLAATTEQKHRLFAQAARLDTRFSEPCFQLGKINWQRKDYAVAAGWLERVSRAHSHYLEARFLSGLCRYYTNDFSSAEKCFQEVAASVPLNEVINDLGAAQSRLKMPAAIDSFRKALEGDSTDPDYHFNLGYALWKSGRFPAAADSFRAVLDRSPRDAEAVSFLGRCLKKEGPRPGDPKSEGRERLKTSYEETAYRQLKAELEAK